jgi:hypothetical protein
VSARRGTWRGSAPVAVLIVALASGVTGVAPAAASDRGRDRLAERSERELRDGTVVAPGACVVRVDLVEGSIRLRGVAGDRVDFVAHEVVRGRDAEAIERARREVRLETTKTADGLDLVADGPFRCGWHRDRDRRADHDDESSDGCCCDLGGRSSYRVSYDVEISLPERCSVEASTVNDDVEASYRSAPGGRVELSTVNGDVEIAAPDLAADVELKTMNGDLWSEFPFTQGPSRPPVVEKRGDGRHGQVIRLDDAATVRIGGNRANLRHRLETLNGDVYLRRQPTRPAARKETGS